MKKYIITISRLYDAGWDTKSEVIGTSDIYASTKWDALKTAKKAIKKEAGTWGKMFRNGKTSYSRKDVPLIS